MHVCVLFSFLRWKSDSSPPCTPVARHTYHIFPSGPTKTPVTRLKVRGRYPTTPTLGERNRNSAHQQFSLNILYINLPPISTFLNFLYHPSVRSLRIILLNFSLFLMKSYRMVDLISHFFLMMFFRSLHLIGLFIVSPVSLIFDIYQLRVLVETPILTSCMCTHGYACLIDINKITCYTPIL